MKTMFSSNKTDWRTPDWLFSLCKQAFNIEADACANELNAQMPMYISEEDNALGEISWKGIIQQKYGMTPKTFWCNPPYSRTGMITWVNRMLMEVEHTKITVIALLPARTDKDWFQVLAQAYKDNDLDMSFMFLNKRLKFTRPEQTNIYQAPFPSLLVWASSDDIGNTLGPVTAYQELAKHFTLEI